MPRSLIFTEEGVPEEIILGDPEYRYQKKFVWTSLREGDDLRQTLPDIVNRTRSFTEDLLEEQRPRIQTYQTLEDNDDTYTVIILALPTNHIFNDDDFQIQVSFVLLENHLFSVSSKENGVFAEIMSKAIAKKMQFTPTSFFVFIISELLERAIDVLEQVEEYIDYNERKMLRGGLQRGWLASLLALKGRLYDASKMGKADVEHIREMIIGQVPNLEIEEFGDHNLDRALFMLDMIDTQRENLSNLINLHLAIASNLMNRQFYWLTIIGSLLIIPTVISSIWGMNIDVPDVSFWPMMLVIIGLTALAGFGVKFFLPKPIMH